MQNIQYKTLNEKQKDSPYQEHSHAIAGACTFCGAPVQPGETVCEECGLPVAGIPCPKCGAECHRMFCPRCGAPACRAAERVLEKASADPDFIRARELTEKLEDLADQVFESPSDEIREEYDDTVRDLDALFEKMLPPAGSTPQEQFNYYSARNILIVHTERKTVRRQVRTEWICNYCGASHAKPSECYKPFLGGKWQYKEVIDVEETTTYEIKKEE